MAVQWGLANPGGGYDYLETLQTLARNQALQQNSASQAFDLQQRQQQAQARPAIQQQVASGNYSGAASQAFSVGDYDALKYVGGLQTQQREKLARETDIIGRLAVSLKNVPEAGRADAFKAVAPALMKQGFTAQELAGVQLTDAALAQYMTLATDTKTALEQYAKANAPFELSQGQRRYAGDGRLIAENPAEPKYQSVPEGGMLVRTDGGTATPVFSMGGGGQASGSSASAGRYQYGWTPRARNGGDNSDAAVDGKIAGMSQALGIPADQPFPPGITPTQIAQALTLSEGGRGSLADRNNNPGNLRDPRTGDYRRFASKSEGLAAATAQVRRNLARGQNTIQSMVEGLPAGGRQQSQGGGDVIMGRPKQPNAPSGYEFDGSGGLRPIRGGPADPNTSTQRNVQSNRKAEGEFRKEFNALPEVKEFNKVRPQFNTLRDLVRKPNPTAQDDIAIIFNYMKLLDPSSVVREGEFATAQNAAGIPDNIRNAYNRAQNGTRLNKQQRENLLKTAYGYYQNYRNSYNQQAENYRGYARDNGINADRVARTYTPDKPSRQQGRAAIGVGQSTQVGGFKVTRVK